jgi:hypothetical protein
MCVHRRSLDKSYRDIAIWVSFERITPASIVNDKQLKPSVGRARRVSTRNSIPRIVRCS